MTEIYQTGETLRITATITDSDGIAADPATTVVSIAKPDGTTDVDEVAMSSDVSGTYYYDYAIPDDAGIYLVAVKATGTEGRITIIPDNFRVEETI